MWGSRSSKKLAGHHRSNVTFQVSVLVTNPPTVSFKTFEYPIKAAVGVVWTKTAFISPHSSCLQNTGLTCTPPRILKIYIKHVVFNNKRFVTQNCTHLCFGGCFLNCLFHSFSSPWPQTHFIWVTLRMGIAGERLSAPYCLLNA